MRLAVDPRFLAEAQRFELRFTCENCLYFLEDTGGCGHLWPNAEHRTVPRTGFVVFCKEFELL